MAGKWPGRARRTVRRALTIVVSAAVLAAPALPARAGTLSPSTLTTATTTATAAAEQLLPWLFDSSQTSMQQVASTVGADRMWYSGYTGKGVGVALVDTGVVPVQGIDPARVANGPDLSFESQFVEGVNLDTYGHGTHLAGIIAGKDAAGWVEHGFTGIAPDSRLVSLKVGASDGAVDVSQVIAAIDWVVAHRNDAGRNVRVLTLAYGTDAVQGYQLDPLAHAVENAWRAGIVVVVAAGNGGASSRVVNPAIDPYVIAVGASDTMGTLSAYDDAVLPFVSGGTGTRVPDISAPGRSIVSLRDAGSTLDTSYPGAVVGTRFFKGSGTSQAAAVVAGSVALLLQQRPTLTPDQVKALLKAGAAAMPTADPVRRGAGSLDIARAASLTTPRVTQLHQRSTGLGTLEGARGTAHVTADGVDLVGEKDIFGKPWRAADWAKASTAAASWSGGLFMGQQYTGGCWCGTSWAGSTWSGATWNGARWSGSSWSASSWSGARWSGSSWSGSSWSGSSWSGARWSGSSWSGSRWS